MTCVKEIYNFINKIAPYSLQESYDNSGVCVGNGETVVTKALIALDVTKDIIIEANQKGAQLIITHHPVIFRALKTIDPQTAVGMLISNGVAALSAHTNFDSAVMNDILCKRLGIVPIEPLSMENAVAMGCVCELESGLTAKDLAGRIKKELGNIVVKYNDLEKTSKYKGKKLKRIAVCSGSAGSLWREALSKGCDAFVTGDIKHDIFIDAQNEGLCMLDAGHFYTENIFCEYIKNALSEEFSDVKFEIAKNNFDVVSYLCDK